MVEIWKPINGYEEYHAISNIGRVKSFCRKYYRKSGSLLKTVPEKIRNQKITKDGYKAVSLDGTYYLVHRLVALHFIPLIPGKTQVNHINCDKLDNTIINLEWCNHSENQTHAYLNGLRKMKLNKRQYGEILLHRKANLTYSEIAAKYDVSQQRIAKICSTYEIVMDRDCYSSAGRCDKLTMADCIICTPVTYLKDADGCLILKRI